MIYHIPFILSRNYHRSKDNTHGTEKFRIYYGTERSTQYETWKYIQDSLKKITNVQKEKTIFFPLDDNVDVRYDCIMEK